MNNQLTASVSLTEDGVMETVDIIGETMRTFHNVRAAQLDDAIREKLIQLGWTPPDYTGFRNSSDRSAVVCDTYHYRPIDGTTPRGAKLILINKAAGVATLGSIGTHVSHWNHWAPLPTFK